MDLDRAEGAHSWASEAAHVLNRDKKETSDMCGEQAKSYQSLNWRVLQISEAL